ncbi:hypothetical protein TWF694_004648 [Orbilia ellipsospora]|uniref:Uncharacterized protein n=1 Tax=Orbilia ellipsospora TaxID=2528407 RepID=A0AAV9WVY2_9PEZI
MPYQLLSSLFLISSVVFEVGAFALAGPILEPALGLDKRQAAGCTTKVTATKFVPVITTITTTEGPVTFTVTTTDNPITVTVTTTDDPITVTVTTTDNPVTVTVTTTDSPDTTTVTTCDSPATTTVTIVTVLPTTTVTRVSNSVFTTTESPTTPGGTYTVIDYTTLVTTTITVAGSIATVSTHYPTNSAGSTIVDGSAKATVFSVVVPPAAVTSTGPFFDRPSDVFLINTVNLYQINIDTGAVDQAKTLPFSGVGGSMGYNTLDGYLYVLQNVGYLNRIAADGSTTRIGSQSVITAAAAGDFDSNGQYWVVSSQGSWWQFNLNPYSGTYGVVVKKTPTGTAPQWGTTNSYGLADWSYIPSTGHFWALLVSSVPNTNPVLVYFDPVSLSWTTVKTFTSLNANVGIHATWANDNGDFWYLNTTSNKIMKTNVFTLNDPVPDSTLSFTYGGGGPDGASSPFMGII